MKTPTTTPSRPRGACAARSPSRPTPRPTRGSASAAGAAREPALELVALRALPTAVRGREVGGSALTYRKSLPHVVPGQLLTVRPHRRWTFRKTDMVGGELLAATLSARALRRCGFPLPERCARGLASPGERDPRLAEGVAQLERGDWLAGRALLLDVLEDHPACLVAHAWLGELNVVLSQRETALAHHAAAVRLGRAAWRREHGPPDPLSAGGAALLRALVGRGDLLASLGRHDEATMDLRHAAALDPADAFGARERLARLASVGRREHGDEGNEA